MECNLSTKKAGDSLCALIRGCQWKQSLELLQNLHADSHNTKEIVNHKDGKGGMPLNLLCDQMARMDLGNKIRLFKTSKERNSVLCDFEEPSIEMKALCRKLICEGSNVNARDHNSQTPLMHAARSCEAVLVQILLGAGAHVNDEDKNGNTALRLALLSPMKAGKCNVVSELLKNGAGLLHNHGHQIMSLKEIQCEQEFSQPQVKHTLHSRTSSFARDAEYYIAKYAIQSNTPGLLDVVKSKVNLQECWYHKEDCETLILVACKYSNHEALNILPLHELSVNFSDASGRTPLMCSSSNGVVDIVKILCRARAEKNSQDLVEGKTALMFAVGWPEVVKLLLSYGADVNVVDNQGKSALIHAIKLKSATTVDILLEAGANSVEQDFLTKRGLHILSYASSFPNNKKVLSRLLKRCPFDESILSTALKFSADCNCENNASVLIKAGADVNTEEGYALRMAILMYSSRMVSFLLHHGAKVDLSEVSSISLALRSLHWYGFNATIINTFRKRLRSFRCCPEDILLLLLDSGGRVSGWDLSEIASDFNYSCEILRLFLEMRKPDVNYKREYGFRTPLLCVINERRLIFKIGFYEKAHTLLLHGADVNATGTDGWSALQCMAKYPHFRHEGAIELVIALLERGADPNYMNKGKTALVLAIEEPKNYEYLKDELKEFVRALLCYKAQTAMCVVRLPGANGFLPAETISPLHLVLRLGYMDIADLLVLFGCYTDDDLYTRQFVQCSNDETFLSPIPSSSNDEVTSFLSHVDLLPGKLTNLCFRKVVEVLWFKYHSEAATCLNSLPIPMTVKAHLRQLLS
ncbi:putative ankyrin repeat protein RF_0381 [Aplysia californica]|uniref:Ankyrin repeat protein RF_0381 n=1 Tax=Aplysia californica TaxID=6500 RepID=A0ABM0JC49_APLCA|nr:putative ankyrin repeat protein RF_0381 [Aplysia californica]